MIFLLKVLRFFRKKIANYHKWRFLRWVAKQKLQSFPVLFYPELPAERAALALALKSMGANIHNYIQAESNLQIAWLDETVRSQELNPAFINGKANDIRKSTLDEIHQAVFGYSTRVDPLAYEGEVLRKAEQNAVHDATIVHAPLNPEQGYIYQKIIDTEVQSYFYRDIRPVYLNGKLCFAYLNFRMKGKRFSAKKFAAKLVDIDAFITKDEQEKIVQVCANMGVDYAEIDCMRDNKDGRLYVIDVNTTAYGPAHGLSYRNQRRANALYVKELKEMLRGNS